MMKKVCLALLFCASAAHAQVYIGIDGNGSSLSDANLQADDGRGFDTDRNGINETDNLDISFDDGGGFGLLLGWMLSDNWRAEIELKQLVNDMDEATGGARDLDLGDGELEQNFAFINTWYDITLPNSSVTPYVGAGVGYANFVFDDGENDEEDNGTVAQLGGGLNIAIARGTSLNLGYRFLLSDDIALDDRFAELEYEAHNVSAGIRYNFGAEPAPARKSAPRRVAKREQPVAAAPTKPVSRPAQSATRCSGPDCQDADRDTVMDMYDFCPATRGGNVMNNGCGVGQASALRSFQFAGTSAEIAGVDERELNGISRVLRTSPNFFVEVRVYTNDAGDQKANIALSKARALAVKAALVAKGVNSKQLVARGYGEGNIATGGAAAASNNRVEIAVLEEWGNRPVVAKQATRRAPSALAPAVPEPEPNKPVLRFKEQRQ